MPTPNLQLLLMSSSSTRHPPEQADAGRASADIDAAQSRRRVAAANAEIAGKTLNGRHARGRLRNDGLVAGRRCAVGAVDDGIAWRGGGRLLRGRRLRREQLITRLPRR